MDGSVIYHEHLHISQYSQNPSVYLFFWFLDVHTILRKDNIPCLLNFGRLPKAAISTQKIFLRSLELTFDLIWGTFFLHSQNQDYVRSLDHFQVVRITLHFPIFGALLKPLHINISCRSKNEKMLILHNFKLSRLINLNFLGKTFCASLKYSLGLFN